MSKNGFSTTDKREYDDAVEALRKAMCTLKRYSFLLNSDGGVGRVEDRYGRWIEWDEVNKMLEPEMVDWLLAKDHAAAAIAKITKPEADNL